SSATGEQMASDAVAAIERAMTAGGDRADALARAHRMFRDARATYQAGESTSFADGFRAAPTGFPPSPSPFEEWTRLYLAIADYYRGATREAAAPLPALIADAAARHHTYVAGRSLRMRGLLSGIGGDLSNQLENYGRALAEFERARARED